MHRDHKYDNYDTNYDTLLMNIHDIALSRLTSWSCDKSVQKAKLWLPAKSWLPGVHLLSLVHCNEESSVLMRMAQFQYMYILTQLANTPTPIQYWPLPGLPEGVDVFIKREDMTGSTLTGNKVSLRSLYTGPCCRNILCLKIAPQDSLYEMKLISM